MNSEEIFTLYSQGQEAWNDWAKRVLARREDSKEWKDEARADFTLCNFGVADFSGFIFPGQAIFLKGIFERDTVFNGATFEGIAEFQEVAFEGAAIFLGATFKGDAMFKGATFKGPAEFQEAAFRGVTTFREAAFERVALFGEATFEHVTSFAGATFHAKSDFRAIQGSSVFTMAGAEFLEVPDFQQATFVEAPRLDNVKIGPQLSYWGKVKEFFTKDDLEKEGCWRALKRLAVQGHDHASEQLFFRGEFLARHGVASRCRQASFWVGVFYQIFSDFGRSLFLPLMWWAVGVLVFTLIYLGYHPSYGEWPPSECVKGTGKPWVAALGLSVHKSLPAVSGFGFGDKLPQFHACLYGVESENPSRPIIPDEVAFLGVLQVLFSAVMIFLFLLAVRNHFRIK